MIFLKSSKKDKIILLLITIKSKFI